MTFVLVSIGAMSPHRMLFFYETDKNYLHHMLLQILLGLAVNPLVRHSYFKAKTNQMILAIYA